MDGRYTTYQKLTSILRIMTEQPDIETVSQEEFDETLRRYISWAAEWDGSLPADVFFGAWADLTQAEVPVELHARVVEKRLELSAPSESSIRTRHNRIYLEDGRELVIQLEAVA